jgi:hypothetical protein
MDAPPAVRNLGRFCLRATWRHNGAGSGTAGAAAGTSRRPLN